MPVQFLNAAGTAWLEGLKIDGSNYLIIGGSGITATYFSNQMEVNASIIHTGEYYKHNDKAIFWRNAANTAWLECLKLTTGNILEIGAGATGTTINSATNDIHINAPAGKTLVLDTPVYDDIILPLMSGKIPASNYPDWASFTTNTAAYKFGVDEYIDCMAEVPHDYKEGTDLIIHVHFVLSAATAQEEKVQFIAYYSIGDAMEAMAAEANGSGESTIANGTADKSHILLNLKTITGTNYKIGAIINIRLKRIAKSAGGNELTAEPFVMSVGVHYQIDTLGSRSVTSK
jgi:hypothetical protein